MIFSLDVIRARKGDCLILHYGSKDDPHMVMIDGGPKSVYGPHLKPRLQQIREGRNLANNEPLTVDLLMVSHVDDDHIQGILDLTKELIAADMSKKPPLLQVLGFWHNSFENVIGKTPKELTAAFTSQFGPASMEGDPPADLTIDPDDGELNEQDVVANLKVLASIKQGAQLRKDAERLDFLLNPEFKGKLVVAKEKGKAIDLENGLEFTVVGPMVPELKALHAKHQAWLKELKKAGTTPEEALAAFVDKSVPNLSSIAVLAEADGKSMLLTGDARGDKLLVGLEFVGLLKKKGKMHVEVLKVPHHGSANNLEKEFFQRITADHYVFSGNGEHGNPERESLEMLLAARPKGNYTIHITYPIKEVDQLRKEDWEHQQAKEKTKKKRNPKQKVRINWSPKKHSLAAFFKDNKEFAKKVRIVPENEPHCINLLDKVAF